MAHEESHSIGRYRVHYAAGVKKKGRKSAENEENSVNDDVDDNMIRP